MCQYCGHELEERVDFQGARERLGALAQQADRDYKKKRPGVLQGTRDTSRRSRRPSWGVF